MKLRPGLVLGLILAGRTREALVAMKLVAERGCPPHPPPPQSQPAATADGAEK